MTDNNQDRTQSEGQEGIDRETELRNRENETGQQQGQQFGQQREQPAADEQPTLSERTGQTGGEAASGEANSESFVGSGKDESSDYLTKGEQNQDFAAQGQGAQDSDAGRSDIETGQSVDRDSEIDDGSDSKP